MVKLLSRYCRRIPAALLACVVLVTSGCDNSPMRSLSCDVHAEPIQACGLQNPEDMAWFAPAGHLIFSEYGGATAGEAGRISALDPDSMTVRELYPPVSVAAARQVGESWGDPGCRQVPAERFSPHGIDLRQLPDGRWELLVVNHGKRESVELFEVARRHDRLMLIPRGCVVAPADSFLNDVAGLPGSRGFLVTNMSPNPSSWRGKLALAGAVFGKDSGFVWQWLPDAGFEHLHGTDTALPNGIAVSPDGSKVFLNSYFTNRVLVIDRATGRKLAKIRLDHPDNSTWAPDGTLLVASQTGSALSIYQCQNQPGYNCILPFEIVRIDPKTYAKSIVFEHSGARLPIATVAQQIGSRLFLGTFSGDRITRLSLARLEQPEQ